MEPNKLSYRLAVKGLFGRNRKSKFDLFLLVEYVEVGSPMALEALRPLVRAKLAEIRARPGCVYALREEPVLVEEREIGDRVFKSESFMLLSEKILLRGTVGGAEEFVSGPEAV